eukprot:7423070-Pyramimonas_sp.AAC.1
MVSFDLCPCTPSAPPGTPTTAVATPERVGPLHDLYDGDWTHLTTAGVRTLSPGGGCSSSPPAQASR